MAVFPLVDNYSAQRLIGMVCLSLALGPYLRYTTILQAQAVTLYYVLARCQITHISYCDFFTKNKCSNFNLFVYNTISVVRQLKGNCKFCLKMCVKIVLRSFVNWTAVSQSFPGEPCLRS